MIICNRFSGWQQLIFKFFFCFQKKNKLPHSTHRTVAVCHWHCIPSIRDWFVTCSSRFYSKSSSPIATYSLSFTELWIVRLNMYCTTAVLGWINFPFFFSTSQIRCDATCPECPSRSRRGSITNSNSSTFYRIEGLIYIFGQILNLISCFSSPEFYFIHELLLT